MNYYNRNDNLIPVSREFIEDALYERFDAVKDRRASEIHNKVIDIFIEMVAECGGPIHSASYVIDNWLINGEHGTYEDCWTYSLNKDEERQDTQEQIDEVENYLSDNCYMFDRDLEEYCSY